MSRITVELLECSNEEHAVLVTVDYSAKYVSIAKFEQSPKLVQELILLVNRVLEEKPTK